MSRGCQAPRRPKPDDARLLSETVAGVDFAEDLLFLNGGNSKK